MVIETTPQVAGFFYAFATRTPDPGNVTWWWTTHTAREKPPSEPKKSVQFDLGLETEAVRATFSQAHSPGVG
jgi:hypothetical protein